MSEQAPLYIPTIQSTGPPPCPFCGEPMAPDPRRAGEWYCQDASCDGHPAPCPSCAALPERLRELTEFYDRCQELGATETDIVKHALEDQERLKEVGIENSSLRAAIETAVEKEKHTRAVLKSMESDLRARLADAERELDRLLANPTVRQLNDLWLEEEQIAIDALKRAEAAERALSDLRETLAWRPIATAPKDGTNILVFDQRPVVATWHTDWYCWLEVGPSTTLFPTHWLPLPASPEGPR